MLSFFNSLLNIFKVIMTLLLGIEFTHLFINLSLWFCLQKFIGKINLTFIQTYVDKGCFISNQLIILLFFSHQTCLFSSFFSLPCVVFNFKPICLLVFDSESLCWISIVFEQSISMLNGSLCFEWICNFMVFVHPFSTKSTRTFTFLRTNDLSTLHTVGN